MPRSTQDDNTSTTRSAARQKLEAGKEAGAAWGGAAIGALVSILLLLPQFIFSLVIGFTDLFIQFIGLKNAATDVLYNDQVRTMFRIVGSLILAVGLFEGLVTANIVSQFGVGTEMEDFTFILACFVGAIVGYIMAKVDVSIYITDTSAMSRWKVSVSYAVRVAMAVAYPMITAVGVQLFVLRSEIEQVISGHEAVVITEIKDREVALIRDHENAEIADARMKDVDARKVEAAKLKIEYDAHMADLKQKRDGMTHDSKLTSLMEGIAAAEAARNQFEQNEAKWQQDFNKRKDESTATLDKRVKDALDTSHAKAKDEVEKIQNLTPAEVADRYDHSWVIKRSFSNKLDALEELLLNHPNKAIVASFVKWGIVVFVSLILLLKLLSPDSVKAYFSADAQAAAGDEKMKKSLEVQNGKGKEILDKQERERAAAEEERVAAVEAESQARIQAIQTQAALREADAEAVLQRKQAELQAQVDEQEARHRARLEEIEQAAEQQKLSLEKDKRQAEMDEAQHREDLRAMRDIRVLRTNRVKYLEAILVGLDAVVKEMKLLNEGFSMTAFNEAVGRLVNPTLILLATVEEALESVYQQEPIPWPSHKVPYPDPRGKTPEQLAVDLGLTTEEELELESFVTNPAHFGSPT